MGSVSKTIGIIVTSHRAVRIGPSIGALVQEVLTPAARAASINLKLVEVKKFGLPIFEGPMPPKMMAGKGIPHEDEASRAWSEEMASLDGFIFVINEYNGVSGATKNAIDFLYGEFVDKVAAVVSYGGQGGSLANEQMRATLARFPLAALVKTHVELPFAGGLGPDVFLSVNEGKIGEESRKLWTTEKAVDLLKAFGELEAKLKTEMPADI